MELMKTANWLLQNTNTLLDSKYQVIILQKKTNSTFKKSGTHSLLRIWKLTQQQISQLHHGSQGQQE